MPADFKTDNALVIAKLENLLAVESVRDAYWATRFVGTDNNSAIIKKTQLEKGAGDKIKVGMDVPVHGDGVDGDEVLDGTDKMKLLTTYDDAVMINLRRQGIKTNGRMSQQRVPWDMAERNKNSQKVWHGTDLDQHITMVLSGARGVNPSPYWHRPLGWTGSNAFPLQAPDSDHIMYAEGRTAMTSLTASDLMSVDLLDRVAAQVNLVEPPMEGINIKGQKNFVVVMSYEQSFALTRSVSSNMWTDIHKNTDGKDSPIYTGALGMWKNLVLHEYHGLIKFDNYGSGGDVVAQRALCFGAMAGMIAWGGYKNSNAKDGFNRMNLVLETEDGGNILKSFGGAIYGVKKSRFNGKDIGVMAVDTSYQNPKTAA